jgi:flagellar hook assembly protein FlgD
VSLRVFDAAGRLVRTLIREDLPEGSHAITWYGKDDGGRSVQSGRYFYRLEAGHEVRTGSVIRLQ